MNSNNSLSFTQLYFGISGKAFMFNGGYLMSHEFDINKEKSTLFKTSFYVISESDIKFVLGTFKNQVESNIDKEDVSIRTLIKESNNSSLKDLNPNSNELKDLKLLIDKDLSDQTVIQQFKEEYKYEYELVDRDRIETAILSNEKGVAFIYEFFKPLPYFKNSNLNYYTNLFYIFKAEDYSQLFFYVINKNKSLPVSTSKGRTLVGDNKEYLSNLNSVID